MITQRPVAKNQHMTWSVFANLWVPFSTTDCPINIVANPRPGNRFACKFTSVCVLSILPNAARRLQIYITVPIYTFVARSNVGEFAYLQQLAVNQPAEASHSCINRL